MKGKRLLCTLLALVIVLGLIPLGSISAKAATALPDSVYLTQVGSSTCTLSATAMMLRARMYLSGNDLWRTISEQSIRSTAWVEGVGLKWSFTYTVQDSSMKVANASVSGISVSQLKSLLDKGIITFEEYVSALAQDSQMPVEAFRKIVENRKNAALAQTGGGIYEM